MKRKAMKLLRELEVEAPPDQPLRKRVKPQPAEYLEEPRSLEGLWKAAFPVGTPRSKLDSPLYHSFKWDFSNLERELEEGGKLYKKNSKVYLFGATEEAIVQQVMVVLIPVVVAVVSASPPSNELGLVENEGEVEEIIPMKRLKMDWAPYVPLDKRALKAGPEIFVLRCTQRRAALKHKHVKGNGDLVKFEYAVPYLDPAAQLMHREVEDDQEEEEEYFSANDDQLEELYFSGEDEGQVIEEDHVKVEEGEEEAKRDNINGQIREGRGGGRRRSLENMRMRIYKFYPIQTADSTPDISEVKNAFVNRYYGSAHEIL